MSAWDKILPHRLLINRSLRKASEEIRSHVDEYQLEYNREIERCTVEIEQAKADKDRNFENVKSSLQEELSKDSTFFDSVQIGLLEYVDIYLRRQYLNKIREIKKLERRILVEYGDFLSDQMKLIGEEIDILEVRKDKLVLQTCVDDIVELIGLSDCEMTIGIGSDAQFLLSKVAEMLEPSEASNWIKRQSLMKLRTILQERVDLLPVIQYITWTISQKKQLSRQLSTERSKVIEDKTAKANELQEVIDKIDVYNRSLDEQARMVRELWAIPITQLNIQISFLYRKLDRIFLEIKDVGERIEQMKRLGSGDSLTWDRLWREKNDLKEQIPQIKAEIESLKSERQQWSSRKQMIYSLCKRNEVYLISDYKSEESDEYRIINNRLEELYRIGEESNKGEKERFEKESVMIQQRRKEKTEDVYAIIKSAEKSQADKNSVLRKAAQQLSSSKSRDERFFLLKVFSNTEEVTKAKQALKVAEEQKITADNHLIKLKVVLAKTISEFDGQIESARPIPYRPSPREKEEILKLENRKTELISKKSKKKSAHKEDHNDISN